jgi:hypothetical protein
MPSVHTAHGLLATSTQSSRSQSELQFLVRCPTLGWPRAVAQAHYHWFPAQGNQANTALIAEHEGDRDARL